MKFPPHTKKCLKIHHQNIIKITKKDYKEKLVKNIKIFLKKKKKRSSNVVVSIIKIYQNMENKSLLSIEKNIKK